MRFKDRRNQSTILLSYVSWCCQYSQSTKELGYFRKLQNQTNHVPAPQRKASRTCDLAGLAPWGDRQGSRKIKAGKPRSPGQGSVQEECPGGGFSPTLLKNPGKRVMPQLSQYLSFTGQGCPGGRIPRPSCSLPFG